MWNWLNECDSVQYAQRYIVRIEFGGYTHTPLHNMLRIESETKVSRTSLVRIQRSACRCQSGAFEFPNKIASAIKE